MYGHIHLDWMTDLRFMLIITNIILHPESNQCFGDEFVTVCNTAETDRAERREKSK